MKGFRAKGKSGDGLQKCISTQLELCELVRQAVFFYASFSALLQKFWQVGISRRTTLSGFLRRIVALLFYLNATIYILR